MAEHQTPQTAPGTTRRSVLRAGGLGLMGAAFLAACSKDDAGTGGISGTPPSSTSLPATVPAKPPSEAALAADVTQLQTAASVELLVSQLYTKWGPKLTNAAFVDHAARFADDHAAASEVYAAALTDGATVEPNAYLLENFVTPAEQGLVDDASILNFLRAAESTITANAINAVGIFTTAEWRQRTMAFGAASARRVTVLDNAGEGSVPTSALYPLTDLMPNDAFLSPDASTTTTTEAPA